MRPTALLQSAARRHPPPPTAARYRLFQPFATRWIDNDVYGHLNNAMYSTYFDSAINSYLINHVGMPLPGTPEAENSSTPIGLAIHSATTFSASVSYPQPLLCGIAVSEIGRSSVTWEAAIFAGEYVSSENGGDGGCWMDGEEGAGVSREGGEVSFGRQVRLVGGVQAKAAAHGSFKHVFVGRESRKSVELPAEMRRVVERLLIKGE